MAYTALRPCCFSGEKFTVGQSVPAELIRPGVADALVKMGVIAPQGGQAPKAAPAPVEAVTLTVHAEEQIGTEAVDDSTVPEENVEMEQVP